MPRRGVKDRSITQRGGSGRIGADAEHQPLSASKEAIEGAGFARRRIIRVKEHLADHGVAADASQRIREICGGGSTPPRRTKARKPFDNPSSANIGIA